MKGQTKLLLTGFEPFGGSGINVSEMVVRKLAEKQPIGMIRIIPKILPVDKNRAPQDLLQMLQASHPDVVLCLGEATRRAVISIERIAVNLMDFRIPDNQGNQSVDEPILSDGPPAYFSTLPSRKIFRAIQAAGIPVELSMSAGTYICNQVFYCLLNYLDTMKLGVSGGFIHIPALPSQAANTIPPYPSMAFETSLVAVEAAINVIGQSAKD
jgi:pyroglutamyl-peptidase